jgi:deoxyribose-phosphate aldolase
MGMSFSAGGVVIKKERGKPKVLLIKDGYGRWTWAKGHIEKGESPEKAAIREISEETGLKKLELIERLGKQEYFFQLKGERIFKTVYVFLIKASAREKLCIQREEVADAAWYWPEEAAQKIEYKGQPEYVKKAVKIFKRKFC